MSPEMGACEGGFKRAMASNRSENMTRLPRIAVMTLFVGLSAASVCACNPTVNPRGNLLTPAALDQITPGSTDKATVTRILGSPSSVATFDDHTWYYISQRTEELAFFKPEVVDREVVVVTFNSDNVVSDVQKLHDRGRNDLEPVARTTPAPGKELSFIEQLLGNFGRFNPASAQGSPGGP